MILYCPGCSEDIAVGANDCQRCGRPFKIADEIAQRAQWPAFATKAIEDARFEFALVQGDD